MHMRDNDVRVNDEPKYTVLNPTEDHHAIVVDLDDDHSNELRIPLSSNGVFSYFPIRVPSKEEYDRSDLALRIDLTADDPEWNPTREDYGKMEADKIDSSGSLQFRNAKKEEQHDGPVFVAAFHTLPEDGAHDSELGTALAGNRRISTVRRYRPQIARTPPRTSSR